MENTSLNDDFSNRNETDLLSTNRKKHNFEQFLKIVEQNSIELEDKRIKYFP